MNVIKTQLEAVIEKNEKKGIYTNLMSNTL